MVLVLIQSIMNDLFEQIIKPDNLDTAWQIVKTKGRAGGIDKITVQMFDQQAANHLGLLYQQLVENTYTPEPYKTFFIPKNEDEFRKLGLPCVKDKIVQSATKIVIEPIFERMFTDVSYGYRKGKGPVRAINRVRFRINAEKNNWVTLADIDNFFDTIHPDILFTRLETILKDERLLGLIKLWVKIGSVNFKSQYQGYAEGVPQGCILSPLLSNFYLHPFDEFMISKKHGLVRYADDFVILSKSQEQASAALRDAKYFLETHLKLKLNADCVVKKVANSFEFLHILFTGQHISISEERQYKLIEKIDSSIVVTNSKPDELKIFQTLNGIRNYYGKLMPQYILEKLDEAVCDTVAKKMAIALQKKEIRKMPDITDYLNQLGFLSKSYKTKKLDNIAAIQKYIGENKQPKITDTDKKVKKKIEQKRAKYEAIADADRELVITKPGVFIGKTQKGISVKEYGVKKLEKPFFNLKQITILSEGVSLSGNVIQYCAANKIPIDFIGFDGLPYAKLYAPTYPDAALGLLQTAALENGMATQLVKKFIEGKLKNQLGLIKYYHKYRKDKDPDYAEVYLHHVTEIEKVIQQVKAIDEPLVVNTRQVIMGYEGHASALYWDMVVRLLNNYTVFEQRNHQGATDLVNCMINYGYGILYSRVWEAVIRSQLNPHISFLHTPRIDEPTLAFDLIEEFRQQAVDKAVFALITKGEDLTMIKGAIAPKTKTRLVEKVLERLNSKEIFRGKEMRLIEIIHFQARAVGLHLKLQEKYKPYIAKW